ncbi:MAG: glucose-6-phosphate isomerase [Spirochaetia bacterium]
MDDNQTNESSSIFFDLTTGLSPEKESLKRNLSNLRGLFLDNDALEKMIKEEDQLAYEFYDMGVPETANDIAYGTSITYPGLVGEEYFMTKGHFHTVLETAEVYYCMRGHGYMLMESPEGDWEAREMKPGVAVYVPGRYAHRSINVSLEEPLVSFFAFRGDAGHDYGTIETQGFRKLCVRRNGKTEFVDNPRWKK